MLIGRMAAGDSSALAALYDETAAVVHGLVRRIVQDDQAGEEVTGDVFLQAWRQAFRYEAGRGSALAWLLAIARTRAIDRIRVRRAWRGAEEPIASATNLPCGRPGPEDLYSAAERRGRVQGALGDLPAEQREVVELAYYGGLSHVEIAEELGQPLGTVKTRIRLAMMKLREALAGVGSQR
jgi:RNA polymerase sigma-70 factor (ECF subfamily)